MENLFMLLIYLSAGFALARVGIAKSAHYKPLMDLAFNLLIPASILLSFADLELSGGIFASFAVILACIALSIAAGFAIASAFRLDEKEKYALVLCGFFGNVGFLGFPITESILGKDSVALAAILSIAYVLPVYLLVFPLVDMRLSGKKLSMRGFAEAFLSPPVLAALMGLALILAGIKLTPVLPLLGVLDAFMTPVSMLAIGLFVSDKLKVKINRDVLSIVAAKCFIFPVITLVLLYLFGAGLPSKQIFLLSLMPLAISSFILFHSLKVGLDKLIVDSIIVSTAVSLSLVFILSASGIL